jgi:hypothetical protein
MTPSIQAELPDQLAQQGQELVKNGWVPDHGGD